MELTFITYATPGPFQKMADDMVKSCKALNYHAISIDLPEKGNGRNFYGYAMMRCLEVVDHALCNGPVALVDADQRVISSSLIGPGNPLMTRDGTITSEDELGNLTIISSGTGGKADILVQGSDLQRNSESFIYNDRSGTQDPTSPTNDIVLGQRGASTELDMAQRRKEAIDSGIFPFQPVDSVLSLSGTASGP
ncbi:MAG: hypothetical protein EBT93_15155, partial [Alphaproteobacteria bacterium]|nr:hypothetical protein [Alphaproteobacteria bacterium]